MDTGGVSRATALDAPTPACQAVPVCGRYGTFIGTTAVAEAFSAVPAPETAGSGPCGDIAPGSDVAVVVERPLRRPGAAPAPGRRLHLARWGLLPAWADDPAAARRAVNARSETAADRPTFREAMRSFRAVVPASCWYEWQAPGQPWAVSRGDGALLALAGLCSWWCVPEGVRLRSGPALHGPWLLTCTILTREAGPDLTWLHPREPVVLTDAAVDDWLDPDLHDGRRASALLRAPRPALEWREADPRGTRPVARPDPLPIP